MEPGIADFIAQAAQLLFHREQGREDFFLAVEEKSILGLARTGGVDDLIAVLAGLHDGIEVVGISGPGLLLEVEIVNGGKEIDNGNAAVAKPGSVVQTELGGGVQGNTGCLAGSQHNDGDFGQRIVPDLAEQVSLGVVVIENGLGAEGSFDGVHVSILQFIDDFFRGDGLGHVDHEREVIIQDVQRRYKTCSADFCCPLTGVLLVVDDGFQTGNVLECFSDDRVAAGLQVVPGFAVFRIENHKAGQDFRAQLLRQMGREQGQLIGCAKGVEQEFRPP